MFLVMSLRGRLSMTWRDAYALCVCFMFGFGIIGLPPLLLGCLGRPARITCPTLQLFPARVVAQWTSFAEFDYRWEWRGFVRLSYNNDTARCTVNTCRSTRAECVGALPTEVFVDFTGACVVSRWRVRANWLVGVSFVTAAVACAVAAAIALHKSYVARPAPQVARLCVVHV